MNRRAVLVFSLIVALVAAGCGELVPAPQPNSPTGNFEALWSDFDAFYALFGVRGVDWDSLYGVYRPRVHDAMPEDELHEVMCELLQELRDGHVWLHAPGQPFCRSTARDTIRWYADGEPGNDQQEWAINRALLHRQYLVPGEWGEADVFFDLRPEWTGGRRIVYLDLDTFEDGTWRVNWNEVRDRLAGPVDCDALIIDLRNNPGGDRSTPLELASGLADAARPAFRIQLRDGPAHDDFTEPVTYHVEPRGLGWGEIPVAILTHTLTGSAAEWFLLAMQDRPRTTVLGLTTSGAFSGRVYRVLPNGWEYTSCGELVSDVRGISWEGRGLPPEIAVVTDWAAHAEGRDRALDAALAVLLAELDGPAR